MYFFIILLGKAMEKMNTLDSLLLQLEQYGEEHDRHKEKEKKIKKYFS